MNHFTIYYTDNHGGAFKAELKGKISFKAFCRRASLYGLMITERIWISPTAILGIEFEWIPA